MPPQLDCEVNRRQALVAGGLGTVGLSLPKLLAAEPAVGAPRARSVLLIVPWGGPGQMDTLDMKPDAPEEIRGDLPRLAALADQYAIVRSLTHHITAHNPATYYTLTGHQPTTLRELAPARRDDWPSIGSVLAKVQPGERSLPGYVLEPCPLIDNGVFNPGQHAGFLGNSFDPLVVSQDPSRRDFAVPELTVPAGLTAARLGERRGLLEQLEAHRTMGARVAGKALHDYRERAYDLLGAAASSQAFDLRREPERLRERYGQTRFGQSVLLGRRLIEAGVRLVMVGDTRETSNLRWDTHEGTYENIRKNLAETDAALSALLEDLRGRGLLETTLVLWLAEFGRTPRCDGDGGRDHWPHCYSALLAGGGIRGGTVHGSSDRRAAYPQDQPCTPEDIHATIYDLLGAPLDTMMTDMFGRPARLCTGKPIRALC
jgi:Protein of unknown function (DUF1501)